MANTKIEVKINNMEYTIVSNESEEYVQKVALLVNKKIAEVKDQDNHLSTAMLAVMAAMNLSDDLIRAYNEITNLRTEISSYQEKAQTVGLELESKKFEVENLKEEMHKLEIELAKKETELENIHYGQRVSSPSHRASSPIQHTPSNLSHEERIKNASNEMKNESEIKSQNSVRTVPSSSEYVAKSTAKIPIKGSEGIRRPQQGTQPSSSVSQGGIRYNRGMEKVHNKD